MRKRNWIGERYGKLVVIAEKEKRNSSGRIVLVCKCDCGNIVEINSCHIGRDCHSCGCIRIERNKKRMKKRMIPLAGRNAVSWKGDGIGYFGIHVPAHGPDLARLRFILAWVRRRKPKPELCEWCHSAVPKDLANISGNYLRDANDYEWICRKCHMEKDGRLAVYSKPDERRTQEWV